MKQNHSSSLNILLIIGWPLGQGGHINSTLALSKPLIEQDEIKNVYLLAPKGEKVSYFENANIKYLPLPNSSKLWLFRSIGALLILFYALRYRIHFIHAMDYKGLVPSVMANTILRRRLIFTKAGGKPLKIRLPLLSHLIVFSKELFVFYTNTVLSINKNVSLIKERIDLEEFENISKNKKINDEAFTIFIAMRLSPAKQMLLDSFFDELNMLGSHKERINVVIAGDGDLTDACKQKSSSISKLNNEITFNYLGQLNNKKEIYSNYLNSDLTVGHGRGIMEAMAFGKSVVLLGFDKLASVMVDKANINQISDYNFSGRNIEFSKDSISLAKLICHKKRNEILLHTGNFNVSYINDYYNSKIGSTKQKDIYLNANKPSVKDLKYNLSWLTKRFIDN